jgi:hypothetical protein
MTTIVYREVLQTSQEGDGTALTASTTPTSILHPSDVYLFQANQLKRGSKLVITAHGRISNVVTTPGTLTLDVRFGSVVAANGGAMALNIVAKTNVPWVLRWELKCRSTGSGTQATMMHEGQWWSESVIGSAAPAAGGAGMHLLPNATPAVGTGFSSVANFAIDLFATWSINNANSIQVHDYCLELCN